MKRITDLPPDLWRMISRKLTKRDLISLMISNKKLLVMLDHIPDIWWGKHNPDYQIAWNEKFNGVALSDRDTKLALELEEQNPHLLGNQYVKSKIIVDLLFAKSGLTLKRPYYGRWDGYYSRDE